MVLQKRCTKISITIFRTIFSNSVEKMELLSTVHHNVFTYKHVWTTPTVSFLVITGMKICFYLSPYEWSPRTDCQTETTLIDKEAVAPLMKWPVFVFSRPLQTVPWVSFNGMQHLGYRVYRLPVLSLLATVNRDICRPVSLNNRWVTLLTVCFLSHFAERYIDHQSFFFPERPQSTFLSAVPVLRRLYKLAKK